MRARVNQLNRINPHWEYEAGPVKANFHVLIEPKGFLRIIMVVSRRFRAALVEAGRCPSAEACVATCKQLPATLLNFFGRAGESRVT